MTTTTTFAVRIARESVLDGRRVPVGTVIEVEAIEAAGLVRNGRARLVDLADLGPLMDALDVQRAH